jgi:molybdopterin synthase catalytic subunit
MIRVQTEDFDVGAELKALAIGPDVGAIASFVGVVRGGAVAAMTLEHYPGMTEKQLAAIEAEARRRWPLGEVLIVHRHGRLAPGDNIVLCVATSAHRAAAFEACEFLVDWLKTQAPFWKREQDSAGRDAWVEAKSTDDAAAERWRRGKNAAE